jgi:hypothetical protein
LRRSVERDFSRLSGIESRSFWLDTIPLSRDKAQSTQRPRSVQFLARQNAERVRQFIRRNCRTKATQYPSSIPAIVRRHPVPPRNVRTRVALQVEQRPRHVRDYGQSTGSNHLCPRKVRSPVQSVTATGNGKFMSENWQGPETFRSQSTFKRL